MSFTSKGTSEILVAGCQEVMFKIDVEKGRITEEVLHPLTRTTWIRLLKKPDSHR